MLVAGFNILTIYRCEIANVLGRHPTMLAHCIVLIHDQWWPDEFSNTDGSEIQNIVNTISVILHTCQQCQHQQFLTTYFIFAVFLHGTQGTDSDCYPYNSRVSTWFYILKGVTCKKHLISGCVYCLQLFVGDFDPSVTDEDLKQAFSPYGEVVNVKLLVGKHCGFVTYSSRYLFLSSQSLFSRLLYLPTSRSMV